MILKWAGGKKWLIKRIASSLPSNFDNYIEPFLGGGSFFYHLPNKKGGFLSDINLNLINFYKDLKKNPESLYKRARKLVCEHDNFEEESEQHVEFYKKNREKFNKNPSSELFLYLNKLCFNGIYRENSKGQFNVPIGKPISKWNHNIQDFREWSAMLKKFSIKAEDFRETIDKAKKGDFIYLDPPYIDRVNAGNKTFRGYNKEEFDISDLKEMSEIAVELNPKCKIIISNFNEYHATKFFKKSEGWIKTPLMKKYFISGKAKGVYKFKEILISNFPITLD